MKSLECAEIEFYGVTAREVADGRLDHAERGKGRLLPRVRFVRASCTCGNTWLAVAAVSVSDTALECPQCGAENSTATSVNRR